MAGTAPWSPAPLQQPTYAPNDALARIDRNTAQILHWVRFGFVIVIILLLLVALGF